MSKIHDKLRHHDFIHNYLQTGRRGYLQLTRNNLQFIQGYALLIFFNKYIVIR